jgi:hypothetical protein
MKRSARAAAELFPGTGPSRGLGVIFIIFGLFSCVMMSAAALYSKGLLRVRISALGWQEIYVAHFVCTAGCAGLYLWLGYKQTMTIPGSAVVTFALGMLIYSVLFLGAGLLLVSGLVPAWSALVPGLFLIAHGRLLMRGHKVPPPAGR